MPLSWNEIKTRASAFVLEWKDKAPAAREEADAQTFEAGFLNIFGDEGRKKAAFEYRVALGEPKMTPFGKEAGNEQKGYIDLLWKGKILIKEILQNEQILDIELMVRVNVDQFYGIEY